MQAKFDLSKLTNAQLLEYEALLKQTAIDDKLLALKKINDKTPKNYAFLYNALHDQKFNGDKLVSGYIGVVLEGSARSRKTRSVLDFIVHICLHVEHKAVITIVKETYNEFKTTLYNDFREVLDEYGLDNPFDRLKEVDSFKIGKNIITFVGADQPKKFEGLGSDYVYFNEMLPIEKSIFASATMRCSKMWIGDYNPSVTEHWVYKLPLDPKVGFLRTTFRDNPFIPLNQKLSILSREPYLPDSYYIHNEIELWYNGAIISETNEPPPHPENVENGTADLFRWKVYGLGLRGAMKGVILNNVTMIEKSDVPDVGYSYGIDFGFTIDPTVVTRNWHYGNDTYSEVLTYHPIDNSQDLIDLLESLGVEKYLPITCDSSDRYTSGNNGAVEMVVALQDAGYEASKVSKTKGVMYWLNLLKNRNIKIVKSDLGRKAKLEAENYRYKEINGVSINQPIDKYNHWVDSLRYDFMSYMDECIVESEWM